MQAGIVVEVLWWVIAISIWILVLWVIILWFNFWFFDFINSWFEQLSFLFGDDVVNIFIAVVSIVLLVMFARWLLSFVGDNGWHSANS